MNIYTKWFLVVGLNSVLPFFLSYADSNLTSVIGKIAGIATWYFLYVHLDLYLQETGRKHISRKLFLSAALRIPMQLVVLPDMFAGLAAIETVEYLGLGDFSDMAFISTYSTTLFTGLYLSIFCLVIYFIITAIDAMRKKWLHS